MKNINENILYELKGYNDFFSSDTNIINPKHIKRPITVKYRIYTIKKYISYIENNFDLNFNSIIEYLQFKYIKSYIIYLREKHKTSTISDYTAFFSSLFYYINESNKYTIDKGYLDDLLMKISKLRNNFVFEEGIKSINKHERVRTKPKQIINMIKILIRKYKQSNKLLDLHNVIIFKILFHLTWRSKNIRRLKYSENVFLDVSKKWCYRFKAYEQKQPITINNVKKTVVVKI